MCLEKLIHTATPEQLREALHRIVNELDDYQHFLDMGVDDDHFAGGVVEVTDRITTTIEKTLA